MSLDQQLAQEQVLELLPMVSEVNAVSEELDKHKWVMGRWRHNNVKIFTELCMSDFIAGVSFFRSTPTET